MGWLKAAVRPARSAVRLDVCCVHSFIARCHTRLGSCPRMVQSAYLRPVGVKARPRPATHGLSPKPLRGGGWSVWNFAWGGHGARRRPPRARASGFLPLDGERVWRCQNTWQCARALDFLAAKLPSGVSKSSWPLRISLLADVVTFCPLEEEEEPTLIKQPTITLQGHKTRDPMGGRLATSTQTHTTHTNAHHNTT